jgi:HD-GYP domain-containing protein (c-di-GMP phosphodiesterase class II)
LESQAALDVAAGLLRRLSVHYPELAEHSFGTASFAARIVKRLGMGEPAILVGYSVGLLHEIGALAVRDQDLRRLGWASDAEVMRIQRVLRRESVAIVEASAHLAELAPLVGMVYDDVVSSLVVKAVVMADQYDALRRAWPERPAVSEGDAIDALGRLVGVRYDAKVFGALRAVLEEEKRERRATLAVVS